MGGQDLDPDSNKVLNNLQKKLNAVLDKLSGQFVTSLEANIQEQMNKLGILLLKIKGPLLQKSQMTSVSDFFIFIFNYFNNRIICGKELKILLLITYSLS